MDELKKYLQENKSQLNIDEPRPMVWSHIQEQLKPAPKKVSIVKMMSWAVAACIIVLAGIGGWSLLDDEKVVIPIEENTVMKPVTRNPQLVTRNSQPETNNPLIRKSAINSIYRKQ